MKWTKAHSRNAVAAKARLRADRYEAVQEHFGGKVFKPRIVPDFTINIRTRSGDRLQITATRFGKHFITADGTTSARKICRGIEMLLRYCDQ